MESCEEIGRKIRSFEERLLDPAIRASAGELNSLLADDFLEIGSSGGVWNKQKVLEVLPQAPGVKFSISQFKAISLGPRLALASYRVERTTKSRGDITRSLRSSIWRFHDGRWQIVFHQGIPIK